jgi:AcrR family transcriptional regulator
VAQGVNSLPAAAGRKRVDRAAARERIVDAAIELVRERSFAELTVGEIMDRAGLERTIFYRHFENVGDLLLGAGRAAIEELYAAQLALTAERDEPDRASVRDGLALPVRVYRRHGPLLRAVSEAVAANQLVAVDQDAIRRRFDELVMGLLEHVGAPADALTNPAETARALNLLSESYLLDAFGREPRVSVEQATETLTEIWAPLLVPQGGS